MSAPSSPGGMSSVSAERIGGENRQCAGRMQPLYRLAMSRMAPDRCPDTGRCAEHSRRIEIGSRIADNDAPAERFGARPDHADRLRMAILVTKKAFAGIA